MPLEFLHRDEFEARFGQRDITYPVVLRVNGDDLDTLLSADDIAGLPDIDALIERVSRL